MAGRLAGEAAAAAGRPRVGSAELALLRGTGARLESAAGGAEPGLSLASLRPEAGRHPSRSLPALAKRTLCPARIVPTVGAALDVQPGLGPRRLTGLRKRPLSGRRAPILGRA